MKCRAPSLLLVAVASHRSRSRSVRAGRRALTADAARRKTQRPARRRSEVARGLRRADHPPEEKNLFLQLTEPHQREIFREEFWKRREQPGLAEPLGPGYRNRYEGFREAAADGVSTASDSDAGPHRRAPRACPSRSRSSANCNEVFRQIAVWTYREQTGGCRALQRRARSSSSTGHPSAPRCKLWYPAHSGRRDPRSVLLPQRERQACRPRARPRRTPAAATFCPEHAAAADLRRRPAPSSRRSSSASGLPRRRRHRRRDVRAAEGQPRRPREARGALRHASATPTAKPLTVEGPEGSAHAPTAPPPRPRQATRSSRRRRRPRSPPAETAAPGERARARPPQALQEGDEGADRGASPEVPGLPDADRADHHRRRAARSSSRSSEDYQRDKFIEDFWKRRSIDSQGHPHRLPRRLHAARPAGDRAVPRPAQRPRQDVRPPGPARRGRRRSTARTSTCRCRSGTTSGSRS